MQQRIFNSAYHSVLPSSYTSIKSKRGVLAYQQTDQEENVMLHSLRILQNRHPVARKGFGNEGNTKRQTIVKWAIFEADISTYIFSHIRHNGSTLWIHLSRLNLDPYCNLVIVCRDMHSSGIDSSLITHP